MQPDLPLGLSSSQGSPPGKEGLSVGGRTVLLRFVVNRRARRYILRLAGDGSACVTIPRGGSAAEARRFAGRNAAWLERQMLRRALAPPQVRIWPLGTEIFFRGQKVRLEAEVNGSQPKVRFCSETVEVADRGGDLRPCIERHLWALAARELPPRVAELALLHQIPVQRVSVRDQCSRWGSCSRRGTVSLNWRLVQAPLFVRDYIILHELAHMKQMNHSARFWRELARVCPDFRQAETWLKEHAQLLR